MKHSLPATFGLRAFPGSVFRVNEAHCFDDQIAVDIRSQDGQWLSFSRGTVAEVKAEVTNVA